MKENTNEVQGTKTSKVKELETKSADTVKEVWPKVKNFVKKTLPYAAVAAGGVILGTILTGRPANTSDEELEDAGVDLDGQKPEN